MYDSIVKPILIVLAVAALLACLVALGLALGVITAPGTTALQDFTSNWLHGPLGDQSINRVGIMQSFFAAIGLPWSVVKAFFIAIPTLVVGGFLFKALTAFK